MLKLRIELLSLLLFFSILDNSLCFACYSKCMRQIKKPARTAQGCIVTNGLIQFGKAFYSGPSGFLPSLITGGPKVFQNCKKQTSNVYKSISVLNKECLRKCPRYKRKL